MKKPSDHLFKLIKTLTKSEKRAFRLNAISGKDAKKYIAIFDAIDAQSEYDEEAIKAKFKNEKWVKRFNAAKDYVYKALLANLSVYNQKHEPQYELSDFLIHIRVLQNKGFYERCGKLIEKAKKLATELDDHLKTLELLNLEGRNHPGGINPENGAEIRSEQVRILRLLDNEYQYNELYKSSYRFFSKSGDQGFDKSTAQGFQELIELPLLQNFERALTFKARRQFINIRYFHALGNRNAQEMHNWIVQAKELFDSNPKLIQQYAVNYATTLLNLHNSHLKRKSYEEAFEALNVLKTFYPKSQLKQHERLTYIIEYAGLHHEMVTHLVMGYFEQAANQIPDLNLLFKKHDQEISPAISVKHYSLLANIFFGKGDFKKSKHNTDLVLDFSSENIRPDLQKQARVLQLMAFYEMGKQDLLEYNVRSVQRLFQRNNSLNPLEKQVFKLLNLSLGYFSDPDKVKHEFQEMKTIREKEQFVPDYSEFEHWVESKILKKDYAEIIQGKGQSFP